MGALHKEESELVIMWHYRTDIFVLLVEVEIEEERADAQTGQKVPAVYEEKGSVVERLFCY